MLIELSPMQSLDAELLTGGICRSRFSDTHSMFQKPGQVCSGPDTSAPVDMSPVIQSIIITKQYLQMLLWHCEQWRRLCRPW